ncbi:hypothetical protein J5288_24045 [Agrobacterium sp. S2/73]|uniref:hypothetical protein n=1 Tax=Rhizobium/Agrobacterium group TaxID=227290 RepID=UPI001ADC35F8|nr:hypothetical protein [Agrobacterium sp. S2/73]QXZ76726.1 hypothetical protein J5276_29485 [Agrobacterium sp. S7/73]QYA17108.1 hypothetical protein J5284_31045 [Rhizobium sp. AB2/73]UEQ85319.1 hypothetical protein I8E17_33010 [Rhizobium sp. AB2/73]
MTLTFKSFSSAKKMRLCLLLLRFRRDEAHLGPLCGGDNRFGIHSIVLLALYEWTHILWCYQPYIMA